MPLSPYVDSSARPPPDWSQSTSWHVSGRPSRQATAACPFILMWPCRIPAISIPSAWGQVRSIFTTRRPGKCAPKSSRTCWSTFLLHSCSTACIRPIGPASRSWRRPVSGPSPLSPLAFLDHLLIDHVDILLNAVAIPSQRVPGHTVFVLGGQLVADHLFHLVQAGVIRSGFFHRGNKIG